MEKVNRVDVKELKCISNNKWIQTNISLCRNMYIKQILREHFYFLEMNRKKKKKGEKKERVDNDLSFSI